MATLWQRRARRDPPVTTVHGMPALSVQLYSIRDAVAADLPGALARLAAIGITTVEPFDLLSDPVRLREALDGAGMRAPSAHARLDEDPERVFEAAVAVGVETVIHPYTAPERWEAASDVDAIAGELAAVAQAGAAYGLRVGYHNHHWELAHEIEGRAALEWFAERLPLGAVLELDTYWAAVGGADVPALLRRLGGRVRLLHLKDGPIETDTGTQLPLGSGAMPVAEILEAAPGAELGVLEFDDYAGDLFEGIAAGAAFAGGLGLR